MKVFNLGKSANPFYNGGRVATTSVSLFEFLRLTKSTFLLDLTVMLCRSLSVLQETVSTLLSYVK